MWLNLEIILSGVSQELTYMWNLKKIKTTKLKKGDQITRDWGWEDWMKVIKKFKLSV